MADNAVSNVAVGKPKAKGAIFVAPYGTTLPADASASLGTDFVNVGYISDDGFTHKVERESDDINAWGGDVVANPQTSFKESFEFTMIETLNDTAMKTVFGDSNVSGDLKTGLTTLVNSNPLDAHVWIIDTILNGHAQRFCIPDGLVTEVGDMTYKDDEVVGYQVTVTARPGTDGNCSKIYTK